MGECALREVETIIDGCGDTEMVCGVVADVDRINSVFFLFFYQKCELLDFID
jgi:hypothetical protein